MAEDDESRTEVSGRLVGEAWDAGDIPLGREAVQVLGLAAAVAALAIVGGSVRGGLVRAMSEALDHLPQTPFALLPGLVALPAAGVLVVCVATAVGGALATIVQTKGRFWAERVIPDPARLFSGGVRLGRIFSRAFLLDLGLGAVKVLALGWAAWSSVHGDFLTLPRWVAATPADQLAHAFGILLQLAIRMLLVAAAFAGADVALVHRRFRKRMLVTKQDAKRETKEDVGDPIFKGKRRARHREISRGRARVEVPRADALLVNPTHIAIALRYRRDEGRAPRVLAKGKGEMAEYMRAIAREHAIPIVQDIPLARLLYRKVKVGREVPASTYKAVAAVLAFVYRVTGRVPGARSAP